MRYRPGHRSRNVDDRRRQGLRGGAIAAGGLGVPVVLVALLLTLFGGDGEDLSTILDQLDAPAGGRATSVVPANGPDPQAEQVAFVSFVLDDVQQMWQEAFAAADLEYEPSTLVLYERGTETGCGLGTSAVGPFYCPADRSTYLDLSFFDTLSRRFGAPGDFAQAYVIAHEIGHHVQNLLGTSTQVRAMQRDNHTEANALSVRQELQADCFAGVWAQSAYGDDLLESGDLEEGLRAAAAIGDDALQRGTSNPETWTHGSSEQRREWFRRGFDTGDPAACNTFDGTL